MSDQDAIALAERLEASLKYGPALGDLEAAARELRRLADLRCEHGWRGAAIKDQITERCPACGGQLFIGSGGYLTCRVLACRAPDAAHDLLTAARNATQEKPNE